MVPKTNSDAKAPAQPEEEVFRGGEPVRERLKNWCLRITGLQEMIEQRERASRAEGFAAGCKLADAVLEAVRERAEDDCYSNGYHAGWTQRDEVYLLQQVFSESFADTRDTIEA